VSYDINCLNCPYNHQKHLIDGSFQSSRSNPPVVLENNGSDVLLVFLAPGNKEWEVGKAIQPTKKTGGSAGVRVENSWKRKGKSRTDFNIINTVQCFPGNNGDRDLEPNTKAISSCSNRLEVIIKSSEYCKILAFGEVAQQIIFKLLGSKDYEKRVIAMRHPNGGVKNKDLDGLW